MKLAKVTACAGVLFGSLMSGANGAVTARRHAHRAGGALVRHSGPAADGCADSEFGQQSGLQVSVSAALLDGRTTTGVNGMMTPQEALQRLLAGTAWPAA